MSNETRDDKLISLPPRDLILSLRREALEKKFVSRSKRKIESARAAYGSLLEQFARDYFMDYKIYDTLKPKEKNELAEIYALICKKRIAFKIFPFAAVAGIITGLGIWNPITLIISFASLLVLLFFGGMVYTMSDGIDFIDSFICDFKNCWRFLSAKKSFKRLGIDEKKIFSENQKTGI